MATFNRVLVALDLTKNSLPALKKALEIGREQDSDIICFHVVPESGGEAKSFKSFYDEKSSSEKLMGNYALPWLENWLSEQDVTLPEEIELAATMGDPADKIVERARTEAVDVIVVGTHGRSGVKRYWMGSVAEEIIRQAPCPVLTVRPQYPDVTED